MAQLPAAYVLGSPLPGVIYPRHAAPPAGSFVESFTLAEHIAAGRAKGCDFTRGNSVGAAVYAMRAGVVYQRYVQHTPGQEGDGALIIRIKAADGHNQGYAHLLDFRVALGQSVVRGQLIGHQGQSGAPRGPHLHCHDQTTSSLNHHEVWNLLEQNRSVQFNATASANLRSAPGIAAPIYANRNSSGIFHQGVKIAGPDALLTPHLAAEVVKDGYVWLPKRIGAANVWVARNFVHFV